MADTPRSRFLQVLMSHVAEDPYPSATQMNFIERMADREQAAAFADLLTSKIESEKYPSIPMMDRLERLLNKKV